APVAPDLDLSAPHLPRHLPGGRSIGEQIKGTAVPHRLGAADSDPRRRAVLLHHTADIHSVQPPPSAVVKEAGMGLSCRHIFLQDLPRIFRYIARSEEHTSELQ